MEIKTDNTHKSAAKVEFAKAVKTKITTTLAIGSAVLIMFSGCQSLANEKEQSSTEMPSTTFAETLKNFESTTQNNENYTIPQQSITTPYTELSSTPTTQNNESTTKTEVETTNSVATYEQLLAELNEVISNKGFNLEAKKLILETFEALYANYDEWKELYKSLPPKEAFIRDKLINSLNYINKISIYGFESKEAEQMIRENGYDTFTTYDNKITFTINNEDDPERFMHEISHVEQNVEENSTKNREYYEYNGVDLSKVFREGEATFNQSVAGKASEIKNKYSYRRDCNGNTIYYGIGARSGYPDYAYIYGNLVNLIGYEELDKVRGEDVFKQVENRLINKYGQDGAKEILNSIAEWEKNKPENMSTESNEAFDSAVKLQKVFDKFILKNINNLKTDKEIQEYSNWYKKYKAIILPEVFDCDYEEITDIIFETSHIDERLEGEER